MAVKIVRCRHGRSQNVIRHGRAKGIQRYRCHDCGRTFREQPGSAAHPDAFREQLLTAYQEHPSMRGITRVFGVSRGTLGGWLKKARDLPPLREALLEPEPGEALELDELWSFVRCKSNKQWLWLALCWRTRQVVAYAVGDRSEVTYLPPVGPGPARLAARAVLHGLLEGLRPGDPRRLACRRPA